MYKILKDQRASPDGCRVLYYTKDETVNIGTDFSASLAKIFVEKGWAVKIAHPNPTKRKAKKK